MNENTEFNQYDALLTIFRFIRDYSTSTYSLGDVFRKLMKHLSTAGYNPEAIDTRHRNYKIVRIETHQYKILRREGWTTYDVMMI